LKLNTVISKSFRPLNRYKCLNKMVCLSTTLIVFLFSSCSTTKLTTDSFENSAALKQGFHGLAVFDPQTNKMIYAHNAEKYFTPASSIKLFTLYTGLKVLGDSVPAFHYFVRN